MVNVVKINSLNSNLLKRIESVDDAFIGYVGEKYIYVLGISVSEIDKEIIIKFNILNKVNGDTFIKIPSSETSFIFVSIQKDDSVFKDIDNEPILIYDENGVELTETVLIEDKEVERPILRLDEYTRNINLFASILSPSIETTCRRFLKEKL
jgi:hypothetical protein